MAKKANKKKVVAKPATKKAKAKPIKKVVAKKIAPAPKAKVAPKIKAAPKAKDAPKVAPKAVAKAPIKEETKKEVKKEEAPVVKSKPDNRLRARDYRIRAKEVFKPMSGSFAVVYFVYAIIVGAILGALGSIAMIDLKDQPKDMSFYIGIGSTIAASLVSLFTLLTNGPFIFGEINLAKEAHHNHTKPTVGGLFYGFKKRYGQSLAVDIIKTIFIALWSLLLIIPGIIKSFSYALSEYIALDNPGKDTLECITESRQLMKGHKWQLFCMRLSYIGWFLLVIITFGIMSFWVLPRFRQANYEFYLHIAGKDKK